MRNPWVDLPIRAPFVLREDLPYIEKYNREANADHFIHTELLPEPFLGSPELAEVILLNLNPGYDDSDALWHAKDVFIAESKKNFSHTASPPFYLLNPLFEQSGGNKWWSAHLKECIAAVGLEKVASKILCIEYFPYHTKKFKALRNEQLENGILPSQIYTFDLVKDAIKSEKTIVIMRYVQQWLKVIPELKKYPYLLLNSPLAATISQKNIASGQFSKIIQSLAA